MLIFSIQLMYTLMVEMESKFRTPVLTLEQHERIGMTRERRQSLALKAMRDDLKDHADLEAPSDEFDKGFDYEWDLKRKFESYILSRPDGDKFKSQCVSDIAAMAAHPDATVQNLTYDEKNIFLAFLQNDFASFLNETQNSDFGSIVLPIGLPTSLSANGGNGEPFPGHPNTMTVTKGDMLLWSRAIQDALWRDICIHKVLSRILRVQSARAQANQLLQRAVALGQ